MKVREHRRKHDSGHGWCQLRYGFTFYPTFGSRFTRWPRYPNRLVTVAADYEISFLPRNYAGDYFELARTQIDRLSLTKESPEIFEWLRENLTDKAYLDIYFESCTDMMHSFNTTHEKRLEIHFTSSADAVKFALMH